MEAGKSGDDGRGPHNAIEPSVLRYINGYLGGIGSVKLSKGSIPTEPTTSTTTTNDNRSEQTDKGLRQLA